MTFIGIDFYLLWICIGLFLITLEVMLGTDFMFLLLGVAALFISIIVLFYSEISFDMQVITYVLFSFVHFFIWFKFLRSSQVESDISNYLSDSVGQVIVLSEQISNNTGRIRFKGSWWQAHCEQHSNLNVGIKVRIIKIDGTIIYIEPVQNEE